MDLETQLQKAVQLQTTFAPKVKKLIHPALQALGLDYFWFVRLLEGSFHLSIGVQPPLVDLYRERKTEDLFYRNKNILMQKQTTVIWDLHEKNTLTKDMLDRIGLKHGMCIFRRKRDYVDIFYIASRTSSLSLYELYLNDTADILRLIGYFQQQILPVLPMNNRDFLLPYMDGHQLKLPPLQTDKKKQASNFYDATQMKKFTLHANCKEVSLTLREVQCVHRLAKGETSKEIGEGLGLSYRTVEHYIAGIRNKTNTLDKTALVNLYRKNDVALWFDE